MDDGSWRPERLWGVAEEKADGERERGEERETVEQLRLPNHVVSPSLQTGR